MKATNIILQGLPADIYSLVNHHRVAKDLWEGVQLLMQGTSLTKQERECKLYDAFDKFTHIKGELFHTYYLRFTQLINDMNIYKMKMEQFQVNTKFLNTLPPEWSFDVPVFSPGDDPIACLNKAMAFLKVVASSRFPSTNNKLRTSYNPRNQATIQDGRVKVQQVQGRQGQNYFGTTYKGNATSSRGNTTNGQTRVTKDLDTYDYDYDDLSTTQAVLMANISNYGSDVISEAQQDLMILSVIEQMSKQMINHLNNWEKADKEQNNESITAELERYKERVKTFEQRLNIDLSSREKMIDSQIDDMIREKLALKEQIDSLKQNLSKQIKEKESLKKARRIKPTLYDGAVMSKTHAAMHVIDDEETLILEDESRSKMSEKAKDLEVIAKKISHKPINYEKLNRLSENFKTRFTLQQELSVEQAFWFHILNPTIKPSYSPHVIVDVPSELPKVSLVNASLKNLKFYLAQFDSVVKKRTTPSALKEGEWGHLQRV
ncbi:hypothetical protein Tco_0481569 [Tanacetum coccineum]